jgi:hypothetical protein
MVHGSFFKRGLTYAAGVFRNDGDNARSKKVQGGDQTVAARVTVAPFRRAGIAGDFNVGSAFAVSSLSDDPYLPNGLRGRTILTQDSFFQARLRQGPPGTLGSRRDWTAGRLPRAPNTRVTDSRLQQGSATKTRDARARSWYVGGTGF